MLLLNHAFEVELHVVAQVVEAELVVSAIGDVGSVGFFALGIVHLVLDAADGKTEKLVDLAHPFGIATREVVVDGHHMAAASRQGVERHRQGRRQGLALPSAHFRNPSLVEHDTAHELYVEMPHAQRSLARLTDQCEDLLELGVEDALHQHAALAGVLRKVFRCRPYPVRNDRKTAAQLGIVKRLDLSLPGVDRLDDRFHALDVLLVLSAENDTHDFFDEIHPLHLAGSQNAGATPGAIALSQYRRQRRRRLSGD